LEPRKSTQKHTRIGIKKKYVKPIRISTKKHARIETRKKYGKNIQELESEKGI
jgi:hypothetical protein